MCTAVSFKNKNNLSFFGRNMDFSIELNPEIFIIPANYNFYYGTKKFIKTKYRFIGTGQKGNNIIFADGFNEKGISVAALYFKGYAKFNETITHNSIASYDLVSYLLSHFQSIQEITENLSSINVVGLKDPITNSIAPLHWIVCDKQNNSIVIEYTNNGLNIYQNDIGVLTNSPDFIWHMENLRNYLNVSPKSEKEVFWKNVLLTPFSEGSKTFSLPGDFTSPSRFIKASYLNTFIEIPDDKKEAIVTGFNLLSPLFIPKGAVLKNNNSDYTQYTVFFDLTNLEYYYKTYYNSEIKKVSIMKQCDNISLGKLSKDIIFY